MPRKWFLKAVRVPKASSWILRRHYLAFEDLLGYQPFPTLPVKHSHRFTYDIPHTHDRDMEVHVVNDSQETENLLVILVLFQF